MIKVGNWKQSGFLFQASILFLGSGLAQCITLISMPVLTRLYTPADFGLYSVFFAVSSISAVAMTLRYELSIVPAKSDEEASQLYQLCLTAILFLCLVLTLLALWFAEELLYIPGVDELRSWFALALLMGAFYALMAVCTSILNRRQAYNVISTGRICLSFIAAFVALLFGFLGVSEGLLLGQVIASAIVATAFLIIIKVKVSGFKKVKNVACKNFSAPKYLLPTALADVVSLQLPVLVINAFFNSDDAGQFSLAWRMLMFPVAFVGGAIGAVFFRRFSEALPNKDHARSILYKTWLLLALLGVVPTLVLMSYGDAIFSLVFGVEWKLAGEMVSILAPMMFVIFIRSPTSVCYIPLKLQKYSLYFGFTVVSYRLICLAIGVVMNDLMLILWMLMFFEIVYVMFYQIIAIKKVI